MKYVLQVCAGTMFQNLSLQISFYVMEFLSVSGETFNKNSRVGFHFLNLRNIKRQRGKAVT